MIAPRQGFVTAEIQGNDGTVATFLAAATLHGGKIIMDGDHLYTLRHLMRAAGVEDVELEFTDAETEH